MTSFSFSSIKAAINYAQSNPDKWCVFFSRYTTINSIAKQAPENAVLCSTTGEFTHSGFSENAITGFFLPKEQGEVIELLPQMTKSYSTFKRAYKRVKENPNAVLLLLCDGLQAKEEKLLDNLLCIDDDFKTIGGSAGDSLEFKETYIYIGQRRVFSAAIFLNLPQKTAIIKENIYIPTGIQLLVTDADRETRTVKTINDAPAASEYAKALGVPESELPQHFMNHPLGKKIDGEICISSPMKVNNDGSITFYCQVHPYSILELLQPRDPIETLTETIQNMPFKPNFIFSVNCILRSLKFKDDNIWGRFNEQLLAVTPNQCGFISYGEQFRKRHLNQTMVLLLTE